MFAKTALAAALALSCALAAPYEPYDHDAMIKTVPDGSRALDIGGIYRSVDNLCVHACEYPLKFDSEKDAEAAYQDARALEEIFKFLSQELFKKDIDAKDRYEFEHKFARIYVIQHNFDIKGAAEKADALYDKLVQEAPKDGEIRTEYGEFLLNSSRDQKAQQMLSSALELGSMRAHHALALFSLMHDDKEGAIKHLQAYLEAYPKNSSAAQLLEGLKSGNIKIEKKQQ